MRTIKISKIMKIKFLLPILLLTLGFLENSQAQRIKNVRSYLASSGYGNGDVHLVIEPTVFDMHKNETTRRSGVYAVRICYNLRGVDKVVYQDCTYDFLEKGKRIFTFSYGTTKKGDVSVNDVTFFRMDKPRSTWPKKSACAGGRD